MTTKTDEQEREAFEAWWYKEGQYCRAGGGDYEKTFAYRAYQEGRRAALQSQDREDAERYRFLKQHCTDSHVKTSGKFMLPDLGVLCFEWRRRGWKDGSPYVIHELNEAIDHARRIEGEGE